MVALSFRRLRDARAEENLAHITCMQDVTWNHTAGGQAGVLECGTQNEKLWYQAGVGIAVRTGSVENCD